MALRICQKGLCTCPETGILCKPRDSFGKLYSGSQRCTKNWNLFSSPELFLPHCYCCLIASLVSPMQWDWIWVKCLFVLWTHSTDITITWLPALFPWHTIHSAHLMASRLSCWPWCKLYVCFYCMVFLFITFCSLSLFWIPSLEMLCKSYFNFLLPQALFRCPWSPQPCSLSPDLVIGEAQIVCHQNHFVLRDTERSDNGRGKSQSSFYYLFSFETKMN